MRHHLLGVAAIATASFLTVMGATVGVGDPPGVAGDGPPAVTAPGAEAEAVAELVFSEGPAWHTEGYVYFTDISNNRIVRWRKGGRIETVIAKSNRANGLCFDRDGMLIACEGMEDDASIPDEGRALTRRDLASGTRTVLCDRYEGRRFNSPNDLCIDREGFIYFTDPYYGGDRKRIEQDCEGVYRVRSDGSGVKRILDAKDVKRPNGIAISPDRKTLYVVDNKPDEPPSRMVLAFNLAEDGTASGRRVLFDFKGGRGGDGMSIDMEGNLYVAAGANRKYPNQSTQFPAGVYVISPQGKLLQTIKISEDMCTNCCFGGEDGRTLFVTAGKTLFAVPTTKIGYNVWPTAAP